MSNAAIRDALRDATAYLSQHPKEARYTDSKAIAVLEAGLGVTVTGQCGSSEGLAPFVREDSSSGRVLVMTRSTTRCTVDDESHRIHQPSQELGLAGDVRICGLRSGLSRASFGRDRRHALDPIPGW